MESATRATASWLSAGAAALTRTTLTHYGSDRDAQDLASALQGLPASVRQALHAVLPTAARSTGAVPPPSTTPTELNRWELLESCGECGLSLAAVGAIRLPKRAPAYTREPPPPHLPAAAILGNRKVPPVDGTATGVKRTYSFATKDVQS